MSQCNWNSYGVKDACELLVLHMPAADLQMRFHNLLTHVQLKLKNKDLEENTQLWLNSAEKIIHLF